MLVDPTTIPVYFNNFNRHDAMRRMIDWLQDAGTKRIVILDNASTYPPLLEYYKNLPTGVTLHPLHRNCGPWAFWEQGLHKNQDIPYVVTDPDIAPEEGCPKDLINRLQVLLHNNPSHGKVGPGILVPGLTSGVDFEGERKYWTIRFNTESFLAPIDTTFAMYQAHANFCNHRNNLRMDRPYVVKHMPSYYHHLVTSILPEEEQYYAGHHEKKWSHIGY
jgi:hypothetical protein